MGASYTNVQTNYNGVPGYIFELDIDEDINVKKCYCRTEKNCPPKGTFDLFKCTGVPMYGSLPHFYRAEHLLNGIESGLHPKKKDHEITANVEIVSEASRSFFEFFFSTRILFVCNFIFISVNRYANDICQTIAIQFGNETITKH